MILYTMQRASQMAVVVNNLPANAGDRSLIPGSGRFPGGGPGNRLQHSCLENPIDRGAWRITVHRVTKSRTRPKLLSTQTHTSKNQTTERSLGCALQKY